MEITLTIAVSTLDSGIGSINISNEHIENIQLIIIHQISEGRVEDYRAIYDLIYKKYTNVRIITSFKLGLCFSRNLAITNSSTSHLIFSDDDNDYINNLYTFVCNYLQEYKYPAMLSFKIQSDDFVDFKLYKTKAFKHTKRSILRLSSIEAVYDLNFIKKFNLHFDELFGLGSTYPSCEQPIFVNSILKHKGNAFYIPETLAFHPLDNSGDNFYEPIQAVTRKKMFFEVYGLNGVLFSWVFMLRKVRTVPKGKRLSFVKSLIL